MDPRLFSPHDISKNEKLGKGAFGKIYKAEWSDANKEVALKEFTLREPVDYVHYLNELNALIHFSKLQEQYTESINIIKFYGCLNNSEKVFMPFVLELYKYCLEDYVFDNKPDIKLQFQLAYDIANGMYHIHKEGFVHRDIKSKNMLIDDDLHAYICDLGTAIRIEDLSDNNKSYPVTTVQHVAPELWEGHSYTSKTDIFAFSVSLYEMTTFKFLYSAPLLHWESLSRNKEKPAFETGYSSFFQQLISKSWHDDPSQRPEAEEIKTQLKDEILKEEMKKLSL